MPAGLDTDQTREWILSTIRITAEAIDAEIGYRRAEQIRPRIAQQQKAESTEARASTSTDPVAERRRQPGDRARVRP